MIVIVDYGMGNLGAIHNMLDFLGFDSVISHSPEDIARASKIILPGVGAFSKAMSNLRERELIDPLHRSAIDRKTPVLGVCLGMQLLGRGSEEGESTPGLGWISADTVHFAGAVEKGLKIPHIGWRSISVKKNVPPFSEFDEPPRFYFVHSYQMQCDRSEDVAAVCDYGGEFCCAVAKGNIFGAQFHPEKSHKHGMRLLRSFAKDCKS